jgi:predicted transcriptional regulator
MVTAEESEQKVLKFLALRGECTTSEIEDHLRKAGEDCPDGAVKTLMRMKVKGLVIGRMDRERRGWVWAVRGSDGLHREKI